MDCIEDGDRAPVKVEEFPQRMALVHSEGNSILEKEFEVSWFVIGMQSLHCCVAS